MSSTLDYRVAIILVSQAGIGVPKALAFSMIEPASVSIYQMATRGLRSTEVADHHIQQRRHDTAHLVPGTSRTF